MAESNFPCELCDCVLHTQREFDMHCKGKRHKGNKQLAQEHDEAARRLFVQDLTGFRDPQMSLQTYFCNFGKLKSISICGKQDRSYAIVEFSESEPVVRALCVKHRIGDHALRVRRYKYRPPQWHTDQQNHRQLEQKEITKQTQAKDEVVDVLMPASNVSEQINLVGDYLRLDDSDKRARVKICEELTRLFVPRLGNCMVCQFGSSVNGFGIKGCDLDLFLDLNSPDHSTSSGKSKVKRLNRIISDSSNFIQPMTIPSQRCPVVRFVHKSTGIKCDLSINNRKALHNSYLLRLYSSDPRVQKLVAVVRLWARSQGLSGTSSGAHLFTSYALTLIVMFFLMRRKPKIIPLVCDILSCVEGACRELVDDWECIRVPVDAKLPPSNNMETDLTLLKEFFAFYSGSIDWGMDALIMKDATIFPRSKISLDPSYIGCKAAFMTVLDPFILTHNVVANVNENTKIRFVEELKRAAEVTREWSEFVPRPSSTPWGIAALLFPSITNVPGKTSKKRAKTPSKADQGSGAGPSTKQSAVRIEGEQPSGEFCIVIQPTTQTMSSKKLLFAAGLNNVTPAVQWCVMAQDLILEVLRTVFLVEVQEVVVKAEKDGIEVCDSVLSRQSEREDLSEGRVRDGHINWKQNCDASRKEVSEMETEAPETSFGKRTCKAAHLDETSVELMDASSPCSSPSLDGSMLNPKKRFCEGVCGIAGHSCAVVQVVDKSGDSDDASPSYSTGSSSISSGQPSRAHIHTTTTSGATAEVKTLKIVSYSCSCKHELWIGRKKLLALLPNEPTWTALALEQEITNLALRQQANLSKIIRDSQEWAKHQMSLTEHTHASPMPAQIVNATHSQKGLVKGEEIKEEKKDAQRNQGMQSKAAEEFQENAQKVQMPVIEFSLQIFHQNCDTDCRLPHILTKLRPVESCSGQFKNLYCSFRSMVQKLVNQHFL